MEVVPRSTQHLTLMIIPACLSTIIKTEVVSEAYMKWYELFSDFNVMFSITQGYYYSNSLKILTTLYCIKKKTEKLKKSLLLNRIAISFIYFFKLITWTSFNSSSIIFFLSSIFTTSWAIFCFIFSISDFCSLASYKTGISQDISSDTHMFLQSECRHFSLQHEIFIFHRNLILLLYTLWNWTTALGDHLYTEYMTFGQYFWQ